MGNSVSNGKVEPRHYGFSGRDLCRIGDSYLGTNDNIAVDYFKMASRKGYRDSFHKLGSSFNRLGRMATDNEEKHKYFEKSIEYYEKAIKMYSNDDEPFLKISYLFRIIGGAIGDNLNKDNIKNGSDKRISQCLERIGDTSRFTAKYWLRDKHIRAISTDLFRFLYKNKCLKIITDIMIRKPVLFELYDVAHQSNIYNSSMDNYRFNTEVKKYIKISMLEFCVEMENNLQLGKDITGIIIAYQIGDRG